MTHSGGCASASVGIHSFVFRWAGRSQTVLMCHALSLPLWRSFLPRRGSQPRRGDVDAAAIRGVDTTSGSTTSSTSSIVVA